MTRITNLILTIIAVLLAGTAPVHASRQWLPDTLGNGYQCTYIDQGCDYSGPVRSTVVRKLSPCAESRAVLYIHGYNDYFFQTEMGDTFVDSCYSFYAVDLRKYGRSLMPGQRRFQTRAMDEYFADIDSALSVMHTDGYDEVVLMGHSTGGLLAAYFMEKRPSPMVRALVLNSPFLDWNMNAFMRNVAVPLVGCLGGKFPDMEFSQGDDTSYAESLLSRYNGEWDYNTDWKTIHPQKVQASWIRAIDYAHSYLYDHPGAIRVPVLLMHSDASVGGRWSERHQIADAVLNVDHISRRGRLLGLDVTEVTVPGGLHDLALSSPSVRRLFYSDIFTWLDRLDL